MNVQIRNQKNILLVEADCPELTLTLAALGEHRLSNQVVTVSNGADALDYLFCRGKFQHRFGINPVFVLLDSNMPRQCGLDVLKAIKNSAQLKTIPVVVLAASRDIPGLTEFYKHGVNAFVEKPGDFRGFVKAVKQFGIFWDSLNEPQFWREFETVTQKKDPSETKPRNERVKLSKIFNQARSISPGPKAPRRQRRLAFLEQTIIANKE